MSPENFAAVEPIKLHIILLTPSPEKGLVSLNLNCCIDIPGDVMMMSLSQGMSLTRTKQGNLVVNKIRPEVRLSTLCEV